VDEFRTATLDEPVEVRPLAGTESPNPLPPPVFWSPDSRFIAFSSTSGPASPGQLKKINISGGPPQTICDITQPVVGGAWNRDDVLVFAVNQSRGLFRVPASGGMASPVTLVDSSRGEFEHRLPNFLPDGRRFLYLRVAANQQTAVFVGSIDAKPEEQSLQPVLRTNRQAVYVESPAGGSGRLLFLRDTTLFAQAFDPRRLELNGEPMPVTDQVGSFAPATAGLFSVSPAVLAYRVGAGGNFDQLTWFDRESKAIGTVGERGTYVRPAISPDGTRVAATQWDRQIGNSNIWVLDLARGTSTKVTFNNGRNDFAVWSPDGKSVAFASNREGHLDIYQKNADGTGDETLLWKSADDKEPTSWSADGRFLLCTVTDQKTQQDIWVLPLQGDRKPIRILGTDRVEGQAMFSPDARWIVYFSDESGGAEIYVRPFSPEKGADATSGGKWLISKGGGMFPLWRGKEIFYTTLTFQQTAVEVDGEKVLQPGVPRPLFSVGLLNSNDVSADGQRFLHIMLEPLNAASPYIVVTNWQAALKK
jgi:eukaryotic-like serine/threonine-protein kinase